MKIALDITPLYSGHKARGIGSYTDNLIKALKQHDKKNSYVCFTQEESIPDDIDLVHYLYFDPFFLTLPLRKRVPTVVTVHDLIPLVFPDKFSPGLRGRIKWEIQKVSLKSTSAVITDSYSSKRDITKITGFSEEKIYVVYLAPADNFCPIRDRSLLFRLKEKLRLPEKFLLYVGDVTWNKNLPRLIEAIKKVNLSLVMVGRALVNQEFDRNNSWNQDLIKIHNLIRDDRRIIRLGFVETEDLVSLCNLATALVMPSVYEGFGLPVLEAMSCGCPVITTKEGSLPEVAGEAAFYVDAYDTNNIAKGINEVFLNKEFRRKLSQKGLEQAKKFNWEKTAKETIKVYEKIC